MLNRRRSVVICTVVYAVLTASFVSAQTNGESERPPASFTWPEREHPADKPLCEWENTESDPDVARACLRAAGVNVGLGAYAFPHTPEDGPPGGSGVYGEGLVTRWAMVAALMQAIEPAIRYEYNPTPLDRVLKPTLTFTDIGWMNEEQQERISQATAGQYPITTGVDTEGGLPRFEPDQPVTRAQMALFFVRTLLYAQNFGSDIRHSGKRHVNLRGWWETITADPPYFFAEIAWYPDRQLGWDDDIIRAVHLLYHLDVTEGTHTIERDGITYRFYSPSSYVTGDQMALFVVRLLAHLHLRLPSFDPPEEPPADAGTPPSFVNPASDKLGTPGDWEKTPAGEEIDLYPPTRPPQEIDAYRYSFDSVSTEEAGIYYGGDLVTVGEPFNLQVGDWEWLQPPGYGDLMDVFVGFRTSARFYPGNLEYTRVYTCRLEQGELVSNAADGSGLYLRVAPGMFRRTNVWEYGGVPELDCRSLLPPAPEGGYTRNYPCDAGESADQRNRRIKDLHTEYGEVLPACRT